MPITLKQLFEKSQLLTTSVNESELPHIERRLDQIESQSKNLLEEKSKDAQKPHDINSRAYVNFTVLFTMGPPHLSIY
jgi:hypothetical protein